MFAGDLFAGNGYRGLKRVVDVSGDGANNQGLPVDRVRDGMIAQGVTINGLPLMTRGGMPDVFDIDNLDLYYTNCVIGGPGAFAIPVNDWKQFGDPAQAGAGAGWRSARRDFCHVAGHPGGYGAGFRLPGRRKDVARPQLDVGQPLRLPQRVRREFTIRYSLLAMCLCIIGNGLVGRAGKSIHLGYCR